MPRQIQALSGKNRGLQDVVCGATFSLGMCEIPGMVNMWGIYTPAKEANMYPKPISDLSGWNARSIACNTKVRPRRENDSFHVVLVRAGSWQLTTR